MNNDHVLENRSEAILDAIKSMRDVCISMATGGKDFSYDKYEESRSKIITYPEIKTVIPDWILKCRYGGSYWTFISNYAKTYAERRAFLRSEFDQMLDYQNEGSNKPIAEQVSNALIILDSAQVSKLWLKVVDRSTSDPEGAITVSRSMLEATIKKILDLEQIEYSKKDNLGKLYDHLKIALNLDPTKHNNETIKQILTGLTSVVLGFGSLRNDYGDSHGKGENDYMQPECRHAELVINLTGSLCVFLIKTYFENRNLA